jgi:hypothetical protein
MKQEARRKKSQVRRETQEGRQVISRPIVASVWFLLLGSCFLILASYFLLPDSCFLILASYFLLPDSCFLILAS